ncbi:MAG: hypothetical protein COB12_07760 [Flavobacterium sp.]|nr:MAG: hypothetical protein COB12_07760 [Flavobacterium sp.]
MKEDFLHYVWKFQKFSIQNLKTSEGNSIVIEKVGEHNLNAGPDFFNSKLSINHQLWAGNVEIHIKSSDWFAHRHEEDAAYDNVILHVVWEHDGEVYRKDNTVIPTLELKGIVDKNVLENYQKLTSKQQQWIPCENDFATVDNFVFENWLERLYLERLENKSIIFETELKSSKNDWEGLLFTMLCKNFGLKVNGASFFSLAKSLEFSILKKCRTDTKKLEALLFGQAGLLEDQKEDPYFENLKLEYNYLKHKYKLSNSNVLIPKYFRLRPPNFPTIRLSQLASLYHQKHSLFSEIVKAKTLKDFYQLFDVSASEYWNTHYNFGVASSKRKKQLTKNFIDLLLINTVIPLLFSYGKEIGKDNSEVLLKLASTITSEENSIIKKFNDLRSSSKNSLQSQALLQLKKEYCNKKRCLQCAIGNAILKQK